ncbi:N-acetyl-gamma-glutamyl-phosphate reductase [Erythrobacter litoralis]|uniref:N-acetyl-gamma-glutamyl-phosphate reductase n=1 Tax=Erythrobacter litoralis TaxID=39960 RepID=A0A074MNG7_9SPHN|nr:N-acetyl-gamma-glutamyl-phosphate reductase [Erythrobacter litoralis]AOL24364.1 N-acetyl-gamma-glutamyl-phosphate reductase [Erythrobacter litoralis]KEO93393.1 N-acetyl-gamma-glutamyl-phosphate reductase [Erythrobacter litoralis]
MTHRVFIDGAAGTTGLEIRDRLTGREEFDLIVLADAERKDTGKRREALHEADIAILCLPDEAAKESAKLAEGSDTRIIDASSAHRVAEGWTYGFPEIIGHERIANARLISNPGCYPTGFLALIAPLVKAGLLPADWPYTVNAVSGYSGGGNALIERFEAERDIAFRAYGLGLGHKHLAEMQAYARLSFPPAFSPSVIPAHRGMVVDVPIPAPLLEERNSAPMLESELASVYADSSLITVLQYPDQPSEILLRRDAEPWDGMELAVYGGGPESGQARLLARLDNLGKGASGAAIQNLNIMCGLPETAGLRL